MSDKIIVLVHVQIPLCLPLPILFLFLVFLTIGHKSVFLICLSCRLLRFWGWFFLHKVGWILIIFIVFIIILLLFLLPVIQVFEIVLALVINYVLLLLRERWYWRLTVYSWRFSNPLSAQNFVNKFVNLSIFDFVICEIEMMFCFYVIEYVLSCHLLLS